VQSDVSSAVTTPSGALTGSGNLIKSLHPPAHLSPSRPPSMRFQGKSESRLGDMARASSAEPRGVSERQGCIAPSVFSNEDNQGTQGVEDAGQVAREGSYKLAGAQPDLPSPTSSTS